MIVKSIAPFEFIFSYALIADGLQANADPVYDESTKVCVCVFRTWIGLERKGFCMAFCHTKVELHCLIGYILILIGLILPANV